MPETRVLFENLDEPGLATMDVYKRRGGYSAIETAFRSMDPEDLIFQIEESGLRGPRRRRVLDGQEGLVPAPRRHGEVPLLQRRRVRARHLQGPRAHVQEPARAGRGHRDLGARGRRHLRLHLHPRRVLGGRRRPRRRGRRGLRSRATWARTSWAPAAGSSWSSTAAPAPTSAARRRRSSTRSRASAATRASSRRSPRSRASTAARR